MINGPSLVSSGIFEKLNLAINCEEKKKTPFETKRSRFVIHLS